MGDIGYFLYFDFLHVRSLPFFHTNSHPSRASLSKNLLSLITTVSRSPHGTGFPLCLCSSAQFVCCLSLCKCVSTLFPFFAHHDPPHYLRVISRPFKHLLRLSGLLFHERNGQSVSQEGSTLDTSMAHVFRHWFIPLVRLRCNAARFTERSK